MDDPAQVLIKALSEDMPTRKFAIVEQTQTSGIVEMIARKKGKKNRPPGYFIVRKDGNAGVTFFGRGTLEEARSCCAGDDSKYGFDDLSEFLENFEEE